MCAASPPQPDLCMEAGAAEPQILTEDSELIAQGAEAVRVAEGSLHALCAVLVSRHCMDVMSARAPCCRGCSRCSFWGVRPS